MVQVKINLLSKIVAMATVVLLLASCDSLFHQYRGVGGCWASSDTLSFVYVSGSECSAQTCVLDVELRSNSDYRYKELFLRVERYSVLQKDTLVDTLVCELYDEVGRLRGTSAGILQQTSYRVGTLELHPNDTLTIKVSHLMDDEPLYGISDVGVRLSHSGRHQF